VGVYLNPPDNAVVLCVDEKTRVRALDRTRPGLPMKKGRYGTMTHDYRRNGTTCLFAAMNLLEGKVVGTCYPWHRNTEFLKFPRRIDRELPQERDIHLLDDYGIHSHARVKTWLEKHPRSTLHSTPTSSLWLNLVGRRFGETTRKRIRRGAFRSVPELVTDIEAYIRLHNENPKPFVCTKKAEDIVKKAARGEAVTETLHYHNHSGRGSTRRGQQYMTVFMVRAVRQAKRLVIGVVGFTVLLIGVAMIALPGPAILVIPVGLGILATEFVWARKLLKAVTNRFKKEGGNNHETKGR
jgi:hypothetical protein